MILPPTKAIAEKWITNSKLLSDSDWDEYIQPNGVDISLDRLFTPEKDQIFQLFKTSKKHRTVEELNTYAFQPNGEKVWQLRHRSSYDFMSDMHLALPRDVAATLVIRSTASRGMLTLSSGFWDSGFQGHLGGCLHNLSYDPAVLEQGVRIAQIIFHKAQSSSSYSGAYQNIASHWTGK
jgi:deoxycytidine triphosphate deaminase